MPKFPTFPTLFDDVLKLETSFLNNWGYFEPNQKKSGILTWSRNGNQTGRISIMVYTDIGQPFIELDYKYQDEPLKYRIYLEKVPSNLGKGEIWYFRCPETNKRCRKLYCIGGYFLHREAFNGCMYEKQTQSKKWREIEKLYGTYFDSEKHYAELHSKYFKKFYNGKPTKRYLKLIRQIERSENISYLDIERLLVM